MKQKMKQLCLRLPFFMLASGTLFPHMAFAAWELEPAHTHVSFQVGHLGLTQTPGIFRKVEGTVVFDEKNIEASRVTISIDTASIDTVHAQRDADLRGAAWFDAERHPKITFVSNAVRRIDDKNYVISGTLTIRGKALPVDFNAVLTNRVVNPFLKVPVVGFVGNASIKRSAFGLTQYLAMITDHVDLKIALELVQKP